MRHAAVRMLPLHWPALALHPPSPERCRFDRGNRPWLVARARLARCVFISRRFRALESWYPCPSSRSIRACVLSPLSSVSSRLPCHHGSACVRTSDSSTHAQRSAKSLTPSCL
eukprot:6210892-Pleurochrysis_carterae.AAC.1